MRLYILFFLGIQVLSSRLEADTVFHSGFIAYLSVPGLCLQQPVETLTWYIGDSFSDLPSLTGRDLCLPLTMD